MAMAGRQMARLKRGRGHSPAASGVYLVGRHIRRPRRYRRSQRAGCALSRRAVIMTAESTAWLPLRPANLRLMSGTVTVTAHQGASSTPLKSDDSINVNING